MAVDFAVETGDVVGVASDLLVLKYAQHFYGADGAVAAALTSRGVCTRDELRPPPGEVAVVDTAGAIAPARAMFVGVPPLGDFRYKRMRQFARQAVGEAARLKGPVRSITTTVHGAGYGLDVEESLQALVFGFQLGVAESAPPDLASVTFVESNPRRAGLLDAALRSMGPTRCGAAGPAPPDPPAPPEKQTAFVAMPFLEEFEDVYEFGIYAPIRRCGYVCERVDESAFAGDIVGRIRDGIRDARFVVADLSAERPNVYLEVGYAWGLDKPVILVAREGQRLHFDLSHHKCLFYRTIGRLAADLERLVRELFGPGSDAGVFR